MKDVATATLNKYQGAKRQKGANVAYSKKIMALLSALFLASPAVADLGITWTGDPVQVPGYSVSGTWQRGIPSHNGIGVSHWCAQTNGDTYRCVDENIKHNFVDLNRPQCGPIHGYCAGQWYMFSNSSTAARPAAHNSPSADVLELYVQERFALVNDQLVEIASRDAAISATINRIETRQLAMLANQDMTLDTLDGIGDQVNSNGQAIGAVNSRIDDLRSVVEFLPTAQQTAQIVQQAINQNVTVSNDSDGAIAAALNSMADSNQAIAAALAAQSIETDGNPESESGDSTDISDDNAESTPDESNSDSDMDKTQWWQESLFWGVPRWLVWVLTGSLVFFLLWALGPKWSWTRRGRKNEAADKADSVQPTPRAPTATPKPSSGQTGQIKFEGSPALPSRLYTAGAKIWQAQKPDGNRTAVTWTKYQNQQYDGFYGWSLDYVPENAKLHAIKSDQGWKFPVKDLAQAKQYFQEAYEKGNL